MFLCNGRWNSWHECVCIIHQSTTRSSWNSSALAAVLSHRDGSASCTAQPGSFLQHLSQHRALPGWERCWVQHQLLLPVCSLCTEQRAAWLSSTGYLCASSVSSFPSLAEEFRGCCCGKERVKGKVRCFGERGKRLTLTGWVIRVCSMCPWGGRQQRGRGTCWLKGSLLLLLSSWQRNKVALVPGVEG